MPLGGSPQLLTEEDRRRMQMAASSQLSAGGGPLSSPGEGLREKKAPPTVDRNVALKMKREEEERERAGWSEGLSGTGQTAMSVAPFLAAIPGVGPLAALGTALTGGILQAFGHGIGKGS